MTGQCPAQCLLLCQCLLLLLEAWRFPPNTFLLLLKRELAQDALNACRPRHMALNPQISLPWMRLRKMA